MNNNKEQQPTVPVSVQIDLARSYKVCAMDYTENAVNVDYFKLIQGQVIPARRTFSNITQACEFVRTHEEDFRKQQKGLSGIQGN